MSNNLIRNIIVCAAAAIVVTSGAILAISVIGNSKPDPIKETAAEDNNDNNDNNNNNDNKSVDSTKSTDSNDNKNELQSERPTLKEISRLYSGRKIPKESPLDTNSEPPQNNSDITSNTSKIPASPISPTSPTSPTSPILPPNTPDKKTGITLTNEQQNDSTADLISNEISNSLLPIVPDLMESVPITTQTSKSITLSDPYHTAATLSSDPIEVTQITKKPTTNNNEIIPPIKSIQEKTIPSSLKSITVDQPPNQSSTDSTSSATPATALPSDLSNLPPASASLLVTPLMLPPPMWVYDYTTGTIGIYYFSQVNPAKSAESKNSQNKQNNTSQNNPAVPMINPRLFVPLPLYPTSTSTVPLFPSPVYIRTYYPVPVYPTPVYSPQPIIIFR
ncbi:MAG: hypothetical protein LBE18_13185 [Planctomycetaceae bacterium]|jgi:hypothetical protein|nr:hypothetical protein [Planctomycetaceae bacterium]